MNLLDWEIADGYAEQAFTPKDALARMSNRDNRSDEVSQALWSDVRLLVAKYVLSVLPHISRLKDVNYLPRQSAIYFLVEMEESGPGPGPWSIVYIGSSIDLRQRWKAHHLRPLLDNDHRLYYKKRQTQLGLEEEEAMYIATLGPKYNQIVKAKLHTRRNERTI